MATDEMPLPVAPVSPVSPFAPVAPVNAIDTANFFVMVISPSTTTGIVTTPAVVNAVEAVIVSVGDVALLSLVTVMPVGLVTEFRSTVAATCSEPHMAIICVVQLPAMAALTVPGNVYPSDVKITE